MGKNSTGTPLQRAQSALAAGDPGAAASLCRGLLLKSPTTAEARYVLGLALAMLEDTLGAIAQWRQLLRTTPLHFPALVNLGVALLQQRQYVDAAATLRSALGIDASYAHVHYSLGNALLALDDGPGAASCFHSAVDRDPCFADAWNNLGVCMRLSERLPEAIEAFGRALKLNSGHPSARDNLGDVQYALGVSRHRAGELEAAVNAYDEAIALHPKQLEPRRDRARALENLNRLDAALQGYREAVAIAEGQDPSTLAGLLSCATRTCDWSTSAQSLRRLCELPDGLLSLHPFLSLSVCQDPAEQLSIASRHSAGLAAVPATRAEGGTEARVADAPVRRHDRLQIAYVSSDLRDHAVAHLLVGVLEQHDRSRFEIHAVSLHPRDTGSAIGRRLSSAVDHFHDVSALSDTEVARLMRGLAIDVALDLNGHTIGGRPGIFALRPAPVQVGYLGYSGTSGAPWMNWLLADGMVIPPGTEHDYSEDVARLPHCYLPNDDRREVAVAPTREQAGLPEIGFIFCAFSHAYKITSTVFELWMRLLHKTPGSVLWLRAIAPEAVHNLRHAAQTHGIDHRRLLFAPQVPRVADHLARLSLADLYLDTLPYNAHSTTCDALWVGVPVLTCIGDTFAGRVAASALTAAGLPELITADLPAYEQLALTLTQDSVRLSALRESVSGARNSSLFDTCAYTRNLESLFEHMHRVASK